MRGRARAVVASAGHDGRGPSHAAPLGFGTLAARMGPAHQKSDRRTSSNDLLGFSRRRGKYAARSMAWQEQLGIAAAAPAEPCYELYTGRGGATRPTRHRMMLFCRTFGALVPCERQGCQHQGGQRDGARGRRAAQHGAQLKRPPRAAARARADRSTILKS